MGTNYREAQLSGTQWQRCREVIISNHYGETPRILMREERVVAVEGAEPMRTELPIALDFPFDPQMTIAVLNPETNQPTGQQVSGAEIYAILYSLYIAKAAERDAPPEAE